MGTEPKNERAKRLLDRLKRRKHEAVEGWHRDGPDFWRDRVWWANVRISRVGAIATETRR